MSFTFICLSNLEFQTQHLGCTNRLSTRFMSTRQRVLFAMHVVCTNAHLRNSSSDDLVEMNTVVIQGVGRSFWLLEQTGALLFE